MADLMRMIEWSMVLVTKMDNKPVTLRAITMAVIAAI